MSEDKTNHVDKSGPAAPSKGTSLPEGTAVASGQAAGPYRIFGISSSIAVTLALVSPILFTLVAYSDTFNLAWNQGRGGFIFAMAFIAAELVGISRQVSKTNQA